jgi:hypothetical protein
LAKPKASGEREREEATTDSPYGETRPNKASRKAVRGSAMASVFGAHEQGPRGHEFERENMGREKELVSSAM